MQQGQLRWGGAKHGQDAVGLFHERAADSDVLLYTNKNVASSTVKSMNVSFLEGGKDMGQQAPESRYRLAWQSSLLRPEVNCLALKSFSRARKVHRSARKEEGFDFDGGLLWNLTSVGHVYEHDCPAQPPSLLGTGIFKHDRSR